MEESDYLMKTLALVGVSLLNGLAVWSALNVFHSGSIFHRSRVKLRVWRNTKYAKEPRSTILEMILIDIRYLIAEMILCRLCFSVHLALWPLIVIGSGHWNAYQVWLIAMSGVAINMILEEIFPDRALPNLDEE